MKRLKQFSNPANATRKLVRYLLLVALFFTADVHAQGTWTPLTNLAPHSGWGGMILLSDGTVLSKTNAGGASVGNIYDKLTPNANGSYVNGTWSSIAPMINTRLYYSSQVLKDGRVYVCGGEYGTGGSSAEVYNPLTNVWTAAPAPGGFVSDANSEILEDGRVLQNIVGGGSTTNKFYNPATNTFSNAPTALGGANESAWLKLPDNSILYVNIGSTSSERYIPATNTWINDATVPVALYDPYGFEMGGAFLLPDGRGFFIGSTGHTAFYTPSGTTANGTWAAGPDIPGARGVPDGCAAMMVDGNILMCASPIPTAANHFPTPTTFFVFNYLTNTYTQINAPNGAATLNIPTYYTNMLALPNGQILYCNFNTNQYYVFTPSGSPLASGKPTISSIVQTAPNTYRITGTRFNGISQGANYGDDWQMSTNYPVIRLVNGASVFYCRTYNWNSTGVRRTAPDTTYFTTPAGLPNATYNLFVTANGIASNAATFTPNLVASVDITTTTNPACDGSMVYFYANPNNGGSPTYQWKLNGFSISGATNSVYSTNTLTNGQAITCVMTSSIVGVTGSPATSNAITMTINDNNAVLNTISSPVTLCVGGSSLLSVTKNYCIPTYSNGTGDGDYIGRVSLGTINNITGGAATPYYTLYPASGSTTTTLVAGSTYTLTLAAGSYTSNNYLGAWIDYDQDKSFNVSERIGQVGPLVAYPASGTIVFTVPSSAKNGQVRFRVREMYNSTNTDPCKPWSFGETEDYIVTITGGGTAAATTFVWSAGTTPATNTPVSVTPEYSQAYTVTVTDVNGCTTTAAASVVANQPNFVTNATPFSVCAGGSASLSATKVANNYCQPVYSYGTGSGDYIGTVSISGTTLSNTTTGAASPFYTLYPASGSTTATLTAGTTYNLVLGAGTYNGSNNIAAWIDYDQNSILNQGLEKLGETGYIHASPETKTVTFTVPAWAKNGTTRLRIREIFATTQMDACQVAYYGETEDYTITITGGVAPVPYTFAWSAGTTPSTGSPVTVTPSITSQYTVTATDQHGCTSTDNPFVLVNSPAFTMEAASPASLCAGSNSTLSLTPTIPTYCQPAYTYGTDGGDYISSVVINGTTLNNPSINAVSPFYTLFPSFGSTTATLSAGTTYTLTVSAGTFGFGNNISAWLDYDQNGVLFSQLEKLGEVDNLGAAPATGTIVFTVPAYAKNGFARLRVRETYFTTDFSPCDTYIYGETEDYDVTITGGVAAEVYNWSVGTTPTSGTSVSVTPAYTQSYTVTATDGYGCTKTGTSEVIVNSPSMLVSATPSTICLGDSATLTVISDYCQPSTFNGTQYGDFLAGVVIAGTTLNNPSIGAPSPYYTLYPASGNTTATLVAGNTYTISVTSGTFTSGNNIAAWIDYDNNKEFTAGTEKLGETGYTANAVTTNLVFKVPTWAKNGQLRLRVREVYFISGLDPCNSTSYGETEDYVITITGGTAATAAPTFAWSPGTTPAIGSPVSVTPAYSQAYTVTATDGIGCTKSASVAVVVNSVLPVSATATPASICSGSTSVLTVATATSSICQPLYSNGTGFNDYISLVAIPGTTLNNPTGASASPYYTLYPTSGATTASLLAGGTYTLSVSPGTYCCSNSIAAWIDFDQNNDLTNGLEKLGETGYVGGGSSNSIVFTVPVWAKNGQVRLRVREVYAVIGFSACSNESYGETEDYVVTIAGGVTPVPLSFAWSPATTPATGIMVNATPTTSTVYTVTASDQYGCTKSASTIVSMITPASFTNNSSTICLGTATNFNAGAIACSGNAFSGNGTSYAAILSSSYATNAVNNLTMEAWVKWNGSTGTNQFIYYNGNSSANGYGIFVNAANANRLSILCGGVNLLNSTATLTVGTWQHVAAVRAAGSWILYLNGTAFAVTNPASTPVAPTTGGTFVGRSITTTEYFKGAIDEVRVWNTPLSAAQINANKVGCITAPQAGLVGYWQFNEAIGSGTSCVDASGGGRTLTLSNAAARQVTADYVWNYGDLGTGTGINASHTYAATGTYTVTLTVTDVTGCSAQSIQAITINPCVTTMNLKFFIQGYYTSGGLMTDVLQNEGVGSSPVNVDVVTVELHSAAFPYSLVHSTTGMLKTNGLLNCTFPPTVSGGTYYIVLKHRNALQTWSGLPVTMTPVTNYDFSDAANKAYGSNQISVATGIWAVYSGDINGDENIDLLDNSILETGITNFDFGYIETDLNGDGNVDILDSPVIEDNINNFIFSSHP